MKTLVKSLVAVATLAVSGYSFAGCPTGTFGIQFTNTTNQQSIIPGETGPDPISFSAVVQDAASGTNLTPQQTLVVGNSQTFCFSENYQNYKLMVYLPPNMKYTDLDYAFSNSQIVGDGYFMAIDTTNTKFSPTN